MICGRVVDLLEMFFSTSSLADLFSCFSDWCPPHGYVGMSVTGKTENVTCQTELAQSGLQMVLDENRTVTSANGSRDSSTHVYKRVSARRRH